MHSKLVKKQMKTKIPMKTEINSGYKLNRSYFTNIKNSHNLSIEGLS